MPSQCRRGPAPTPNLFRYEAIFQIASLAVQGNRRRMAIGPRDASGRRVCLLQHIFPPAAAAGSHFHRGTGLGAKAKTGRGLLTLIRARFLSIRMVMGVCFLLMVSMITTAALRQLGNYAVQHLPGLPLRSPSTNFSRWPSSPLYFQPCSNTCRPRRSSGGMSGSKGPLQRSFSPSESLRVEQSVARAVPASSSGAASSLALRLGWVYESAQSLSFGAEFSEMYARRSGSRCLHPAPGRR